MFFRILLFFVVVPLLELTLHLIIAEVTRWYVPLIFILATGVLGTALMKWQGTAVYRQIQKELAAGRMPTDAMIDGVMILVAGVLLVSPGVLTDLIGITAMIPPIRVFYRRQLVAWFHRTFKINTAAAGFASDRVVDSYAVEKHSPDDVGDQV